MALLTALLGSDKQYEEGSRVNCSEVTCRYDISQCRALTNKKCTSDDKPKCEDGKLTECKEIAGQLQWTEFDCALANLVCSDEEGEAKCVGRCGDNTITNGEFCDGDNFAGKTCASELKVSEDAVVGGKLTCTNCKSISYPN